MTQNIQEEYDPTFNQGAEVFYIGKLQLQHSDLYLKDRSLSIELNDEKKLVLFEIDEITKYKKILGINLHSAHLLDDRELATIRSLEIAYWKVYYLEKKHNHNVTVSMMEQINEAYNMEKSRYEIRRLYKLYKKKLWDLSNIANQIYFYHESVVSSGKGYQGKTARLSKANIQEYTSDEREPFWQKDQEEQTDKKKQPKTIQEHFKDSTKEIY